jgi:hypothetical protein
VNVFGLEFCSISQVSGFTNILAAIRMHLEHYRLLTFKEQQRTEKNWTLPLGPSAARLNIIQSANPIQKSQPLHSAKFPATVRLRTHRESFNCKLPATELSPKHNGGSCEQGAGDPTIVIFTKANRTMIGVMRRLDRKRSRGNIQSS